MKVLSVYSILIGLGIIASWMMILIKGDLPEGPIALGFHLYSEFSMAIILLVSGIMMLRKMRWGRETNIGGLGMLIYSVINAAGYYGQAGNNAAMTGFIALSVLSIVAMSLHFTGQKQSE